MIARSTIIAHAQPKRDYYYQSRLGNRLFDLAWGRSRSPSRAPRRPEDQRAIDRVLERSGHVGFAASWLRERGLTWAADLLWQHSPPEEKEP